MARGVGVGMRHAFKHETEKVLKHADFLEISQRGGLEMVGRDLAAYIGKLPMVVHSLNLSLGSVEPPPQHRVDALKKAVDVLNPSIVSEHLSYSRNQEIEIDNFITLPYNDESIEVVSANIRNLSAFLGKPMAMENVTHLFTWPGAQYSEAEFIKRVLETADCGLLLDVTNLHINAHTLGYDPYEYLEQLPAERIVQMHLAGHSVVEGMLEDSHKGGIHPDVLALAEWTLRNTPCDQLIIERDNDIQTFDDLLPDLQLCKDLYAKYRKPITA